MIPYPEDGQRGVWSWCPLEVKGTNHCKEGVFLSAIWDIEKSLRC
jgi:hypothetical protein